MKKKRNGRSGKLPGLRKMMLMMKLCVFFLFASFLSVAANGYSQNTRLSLMKQNASVIEVLTEISQKTEDLVGPYELHDFFLYYMLRFGYPPRKIYRAARITFADVYDDATIKKWLTTFVRRFFTQQFKRSCLPDGPKVGTVTLSPRGDWRMPSDAVSALWLREAENL